MRDRGRSKIREGKQCLIRDFAYLADGLQAGRKQRVLYLRWKSESALEIGLHGLACYPEALALARARSFVLRLRPVDPHLLEFLRTLYQATLPAGLFVTLWFSRR
jgi:hypothetical protein